MSNILKYKGFQQTKNHFELFWLHTEREDFISKMVRVIFPKSGRTALAIRLSDTDVGSVFIHLKSNRSFAHRWETEDEAQGTASITKHFTTSLAKHVTDRREKRKLISDLQKSLLPLIPASDIDIIRLVKVSNNPILPDRAEISDIDQYLNIQYVKAKPVPIAVPRPKPEPAREIKIFTIEQSRGERIFNGFLKGVLAAAVLLLAMLLYMQFA